jgi:hypothetical protein
MHVIASPLELDGEIAEWKEPRHAFKSRQPARRAPGPVMPVRRGTRTVARTVPQVLLWHGLAAP